MHPSTAVVSKLGAEIETFTESSNPSLSKMAIWRLSIDEFALVKSNYVRSLRVEVAKLIGSRVLENLRRRNCNMT